MSKGLRTAALSATALTIIFAATAASAQVSGVPSSTPATGAQSGSENAASPAVQPGPAPVQEQADPDRVTLGDIVVTARKRAAGEQLQAVPISATAVSGLELQQANAANLVDVGKLSPGVSFQGSSVKGVQNFSIRGVGISGTTPSDEPTVGVFQDGIYWGSNYGSLGEAFDLESIEILRGPQGTLFGRNVTGGAVAIHSARPSFTPSGSTSFGYGNHQTADTSVILNGPLSDTVAVRLAGLYRSTDGHFKYAYGGRVGREVAFMVRPSVLFKPSSDLEIILRGEYYQTRGDSTVVRGVAPSNFPGGVVSLPVRDGFVTPDDYYTITTGDPGRQELNVYMASGEVNWNVAGGVVTLITGYREVDVPSQRTDYDGFPTLAFKTDSSFDQHQFSSELRYAANIGKVINLTTGLFFFHQAFEYFDTRTLDRGVTVLAQKANLRENNSYAAFAEADVNITDRFTATLGGRYTQDAKEAQIAPYGQCTPNTYATCNFGPIRKTKDRKFTPKIGLSYKLTPNNLLYGSYTQGVRSGGFALRGNALNSPYEAEEVTAYELGAKNDFFGSRLRVNVAGYISDYTNIQRTVVSTDPVFGIVQSVFNAAKAKVKGFDVGVNAQVTNELRLDGAYGYVHARYDSFIGFPNPQNLRFVRVPATTWTGGATYTVGLANGGTVTGRGSAAYTGSYFYDDINVLKQKAYTLIDASLQYTAPDNMWSVSLWGKNLGEAHYAAWGSNLATRGANLFPGPGRTYGLRGSVNF